MLKLSRWSVLALAGTSAITLAQAQDISLQADFATDPAAGGWSMYGNTNLFHWNPANQNLEVQWDTSQSNSYFCHPLGATLGVDDDFVVSFDLQIQDATITDFGFELAIGLLNLADATQPGFLRGTGNDSPNLVEFDYFPDPDGILLWGPSLTTMMADSDGLGFGHWSQGGFAGVGLPQNDVLHIEMAYSGTSRSLRTGITNLTTGDVVGPVSEATLPPTFLSFYVDHIAVASYSGLNGWGSLLADGTVDNLRVAATVQKAPRVRGQFAAPGVWKVRFSGRTNLHYTLERTTNFHDWSSVSATVPGTDNELVLQDTSAPAATAFYRVRVE